MKSHLPTIADRRLRKHFAAFAHNLRHAAARGAFSQFQVSVLSDRCVVVQVHQDRPAFLIEPHFIPGPTGLECFIQCRMAVGIDEPLPLPLTAAWRCTAGGMVSRHPDGSGSPLGYLCDSVVAMGVLHALTRIGQRTVVATDEPRQETGRWNR